MEQARDPLTQEAFTKRRSNQKFASARNRIRFNNLKARRKRAAKAPIDKILDVNRTILIRVLGPKSEVILSKDFLLGAGFSFNHYSYQRTVNGITYAGIYEFGITRIKENQYKIIKFNNGQIAGNR